MKKYFLMILVIGFLGISFAQETSDSWTTAENYVQPGETKIITQDFNSDSMDDIQNIQSRFCNNEEMTKDLDLSMRPWQKKDICVAFANKSDQPINILLGFSEGILKDWAPMCDADMTDKNEFSKYILWNPTTWIVIPASGYIIQRFTYMTPKTASGNMLGCIGYKINRQEQIEPGKMFLIIPRKVGYIYMNITWSVYQFWRRDEIKYAGITNKKPILIVIIAILAIRLGATIFKTTKKKKKQHKK